MTKWDRPEDSLGGPSRSSLEAAAEAAAKVNAMLIAKGKLKPSQLSNAQQTKQKVNPGQNNLEMAEVDINDVPISCRNLLTRGSTQDEISKMSGAAVSTRGRYMSPEDRLQSSPGERPLYLCVQGPSMDCVEKAVGRIREIIMNSYRNKGGTKFMPRMPTAMPTGARPRMDGYVTVATPPPLMSLNPQPAGITVLQEKIFIGLEHAPPSFDVRNKLFGPGGMYLQHIQTESGAKVTLQGKGSGFVDPATGRETIEPMNVVIQHPVLANLQQAKQLADNLVQTVQQDYAQFQTHLATMPSPMATGSATFLTGLPPQTMPPPGTTWTVQQPQPMSIAAGFPPCVSASQPQMTFGPPGEVRTVFSGGVPQQTVLVNTSMPPPNLQGQPPNSQPHTMHLVSGSGIPLGQSTITLSQPPMSAPQQLIQVSQQGAIVSQGLPMYSVTMQPQMSQPGIMHMASLAGPPGAPGVSQPIAMMGQQPVTVPTAVLQAVPTMHQLQQSQLQPGQIIQHQMVQQQAMLQPGQMTLTNQPPPHHLTIHGQLGQPNGPPQIQLPPPGSQTLTMTSAPHSLSPQTYYKQYVHTTSNGGEITNIIEDVKDERKHKRRFTEEKVEEKLPENLLGYQHGPPHLANVIAPKGNGQPNSNERLDLNQAEQPSMQQDDKQLMPPPPPPFALLAEDQLTGPSSAKKMKGALGNVIAGKESNGIAESLEEDSDSKRQRLQETGKYQYNQYTCKPQMYVQESTSPVSSQGQPVVHSIAVAHYTSQANGTQTIYESPLSQRLTPSPGTPYSYPDSSHSYTQTQSYASQTAPVVQYSLSYSAAPVTSSAYSVARSSVQALSQYSESQPSVSDAPPHYTQAPMQQVPTQMSIAQQSLQAAQQQAQQQIMSAAEPPPPPPQYQPQTSMQQSTHEQAAIQTSLANSLPPPPPPPPEQSPFPTQGEQFYNNDFGPPYGGSAPPQADPYYGGNHPGHHYPPSHYHGPPFGPGHGPYGPPGPYGESMPPPPPGHYGPPPPYW